MILKAAGWIAAAVVGLVVVCAGVLVAPFLSGDDTTRTAAGCYLTIADPPPTTTVPPPAGPYQPIGPWSAVQVGNAATITTVGQQLGVPARGWVIAVATAMQESGLRNDSGGDRDSVGLFQQRPSQGWGTPTQLHDPAYAAGAFYRKLATIPGWQTMPLTQAAQAVQRSAYPNAYAKWEPEATLLVTTLTGTTDLSAAGCPVTVSAQGWTQPVHGVIGSRFRTVDRPTHDGVDLIVGKGTPIHAAADGVVTTVRCNAIDVRTGGDWGCDRDGDPNLTAGCGWYVDIEHAGQVISRYCHQLVHPYVSVGQHVTVGQVIGISGSSGHSSGPHLHFEIHLGDHTSATATDPIPFMATHGAPL